MKHSCVALLYVQNKKAASYKLRASSKTKEELEACSQKLRAVLEYKSATQRRFHEKQMPGSKKILTVPPMFIGVINI